MAKNTIGCIIFMLFISITITPGMWHERTGEWIQCECEPIVLVIIIYQGSGIFLF